MPSAEMILGAIMWPTLFWGGTAAVSLPILIHLFARRRFKRIRWAAMDFLIQAERRNRRRVRLEEWLLLAMRCAAFLLIALFLARPFVKPAGLVGALGGGQSTERIFLLDDSYSMAYQVDGLSSFVKAKDAVVKICREFRKETPDDTLTILRMSDPTRPVELGTYLDDAQMEDVVARLEGIQSTTKATKVAQVVDALADLLDRSPDIVNTALYIVSDFQEHNWVPRRPASDTTVRNVILPLLDWVEDDHSLRVTLVNVGAKDAANAGITSIAGPDAPIVSGASADLRIGIANHSDYPVVEIKAEVTIGAMTPQVFGVTDLAPRRAATIDASVNFIRPGDTAVTVKLPEDALSIDDTRFGAVNVATALQVLVVNGEPSADSFLDEVTFLTTALRPQGDVFSGNDVKVIEETELETIDLSSYHSVCLANVYRASEPATEALENFVRRGGGLVVFLGDQIDAGLFNATLFKGGKGLSPVELTDRFRPSRVSRFIVENRLHPVLRGLSPEGDPLGIGQIAFSEYYGCRLAQVDEEAVLPDQVAPAPRVLASFSDAEGHPAIVEREFGAGTVVVVTTTADKEWHHWPDHPTFLPMVMELVHHVAKRSGSLGDQWTGDPIELAIDPATFGVDAIVRTPAYPVDRETAISAKATDDGGGLVMSWEQTDQPGVYEFLLSRNDGMRVSRFVAVNVDPAEGDLAMATEESLRASMSGVPITYVEGVDHLASDLGEARVELWRPALLLAMLMLVGEQTLAWWLGRRR